jgi:pyrimidine operon attenuation protein/uracil phosphoribosyltransferase
VVLVDDVLFTGRTTRAAIDAVMDYGRPRASSSRRSSTGGTASCPSRPTTWASTVETARAERVDVLLDAPDGRPTG